MSLSVAELVAKVTIEGDETAKSKLASVSDSVEKTQSGFKSMLGNALSFAAGGALANMGFLKDQLGGIYSESMDAQAGLAQTVEVLKSTHDASGMTAQGILDLATQYSHLTKFSDDTVQASENMLLTFTNIGKDVFPQATKTVLDMSQALGQDTKSSAIQLGKALNDPIAGISALSRVGVTFNQTQKDLIKTYMQHGEVAKAQGVILGELQKEFGGSAEAAGKTFGGQLVILNQYLDDLKQNIGDAIIPVLARLLGAAMPLISAFVDFSGVAINDTIDAISNLGSQLEVVTIPLFDFSRVLISGAEEHFTDLANTLKTPVHDALDTTQSILHKNVIPEFQDLSTLVGGKVHQSFINLSPVALSLAHTLQNDLAVGAGVAGNALQQTGSWIQTTGIPEYTSFAGVVRDKLAQAFDTLKSATQGAFGDISGTIKDKLSGLSGGVPKFDLKGALGGLDIASIKKDLDDIAAIPRGIEQTFGTIGQDFSNFGSGIRQAYDTYLKPIFDQLGEFGGRINKDWQKDLPVLSDDLLQFWDNAKAGLEKVFGDIHLDFNQIPDWWNNTVNKTDWGKLVDALIDEVMIKLPQVVGDILGLIEQPFNAAVNFVANLKPLFRAAVNDIISIADGLIGGLDNINFDMGPVHIHPNIPRIPYLASGGSIDQSGWAIVGEHGPEPVYLPAGAQVYPNSSLNSPTPQSRGNDNSPVYLMLDGFMVGRGILPHIASALQYGVNSRVA